MDGSTLRVTSWLCLHMRRSRCRCRRRQRMLCIVRYLGNSPDMHLDSKAIRAPTPTP